MPSFTPIRLVCHPADTFVGVGWHVESGRQSTMRLVCHTISVFVFSLAPATDENSSTVNECHFGASANLSLDECGTCMLCQRVHLHPGCTNRLANTMATRPQWPFSVLRTPFHFTDMLAYWNTKTLVD